MRRRIIPKILVKSAAEKLTTGAASAMPSLRIELLQNRQAIVEGSRGVLEYSPECIRLSSDRLIIRFSGCGLMLKTFDSSSAIVEGRIDNIEFM